MAQIMVLEGNAKALFDFSCGIFHRVYRLDCSIRKAIHKIGRGNRQTEDHQNTNPKCLNSKPFHSAIRPPHNHERSEVIDEMAKDEARHGKAFEGMLKRYFGK